MVNVRKFVSKNNPFGIIGSFGEYYSIMENPFHMIMANEDVFDIHHKHTEIVCTPSQ